MGRIKLIMPLAIVILLCYGTLVSAGPTRLVFTHWSSDPCIRIAIERFNNSHDDIQVKFEPVAWRVYFDKVPVQIAAGVGPDIFTVHTRFMPVQRWGPQGLLLDLTPYWKKDKTQLDADDWFDFVFEPVTFKGVLYAFPYGWSVFGHLVCNNDMFEQAGILLPGEAWTWNTLVEVARKFNQDTDGDGIADQFGLNPANYRRMRLVKGHIWSAGGRVYNQSQTALALNSKAALRAMTFVSDLFNTEVIPEGAAGWDEGKIALNPGLGIQDVLTSLPYWRPTFTPNLAIYPKDPVTGGRSFYGQVEALGISGNTRYPEDAWEFVKWFTSTEGYARSSYEQWGYVQLVPPRRSTANSYYFVEPDPDYVPEIINMKIAVKIASYGRFPTYVNSLAAANHAKIERIFDEEWRRVVNQEQTVAQFIENVEKLVAPLLR